MLNRIPKSLVDSVSTVLSEKSGDKEEYQKFFKSALDKFGVKSPAELSGDKKKEFFDYVDKEWKGDSEKKEEENDINEETIFEDKELDDLITRIYFATDPNDDENNPENPEDIIKTIEKKYGVKTANTVKRGISKMHFPNPNAKWGYDKLAHRAQFRNPTRITKSGKANKQDIRALKNWIKNDMKMRKETKETEVEESFYKNDSKIEKFDLVRIVSSNKSGLVYAIKGDKAVVETPKGKVTAKISDLEKVMEESFYKVKDNKEKETLTFVNDAEVKDALKLFKKNNIDAKASGKTVKFVNTSEYKQAKKLVSEEVQLDEAFMRIDRKALDSLWIMKRELADIYERLNNGNDVTKNDYNFFSKSLPKYSKELTKAIKTFKTKDEVPPEYMAASRSRYESTELDEEIRYDRYINVHGKKPKSGNALWWFTTKQRGTPSDKEIYKAQGKMSDVAKAAMKELGSKVVYVMEDTESYDYLSEPAVSQSQQKLMGMALAYKRGEMSDEDASDKVKELAANMSEKELKDFASTDSDDLPKKVEETI